MEFTRKFALDLQLFDGAAAAPAGGSGEGGAQAGAGNLPKADRAPGSSRRGKGGYSNVVFGKQEDAPAAGDAQTPDAGEQGTGKANKSGVQTTSSTLAERRKAFDELIDGEYKDIYTEKFQSAFSRRYKEAQAMEASLAAQKPIVDMLLQRYGIQDGDMAKLQTALEDDNAYWGEAAEKAGLTVEQYKSMQKLERENAQLRQMRDRQMGEMQASAQISKWVKEAETVKQDYPTFDLEAELANKDFVGLLKAKVSVRQAYELMHMDEIKAAAAKTAAQTAGEQMAARIRSKASRPAENGTSSQSAVIVKSDVHSLTRADREEAVRRAMRGETIRF